LSRRFGVVPKFKLMERRGMERGTRYLGKGSSIHFVIERLNGLRIRVLVGRFLGAIDRSVIHIVGSPGGKKGKSKK